jgi:hypothetical protein
MLSIVWNSFDRKSRPGGVQRRYVGGRGPKRYAPAASSRCAGQLEQRPAPPWFLHASSAHSGAKLRSIPDADRPEPTYRVTMHLPALGKTEFRNS